MDQGNVGTYDDYIAVLQLPALLAAETSTIRVNNKLNEADGEAAETQNWLDFALACGYINEVTYQSLYSKYDEILGMLVSMTINSKKWTFSELKK